jgi:hypothetical protein
LKDVPNPPQQFRSPSACLTAEEHLSVANAVLNCACSTNLPITNRAVRVSPVRARVTPNPTARIDFKNELIADHAHAEVEKPCPAGTYVAPTLLSRESTLAGNVPAPLVEENLGKTALAYVDARMQKRLDPSLDGNKDLQLHTVRHRKRGRG